MRMERKTLLRVIRFIQMKVHLKSFSYLLKNPPFSVSLKNDINRTVTCRVFSSSCQRNTPCSIFSLSKMELDPNEGGTDCMWRCVLSANPPSPSGFAALQRSRSWWCDYVIILLDRSTHPHVPHSLSPGPRKVIGRGGAELSVSSHPTDGEWILHVVTMTSQDIVLWFIFELQAAV